MMSLTKWLAAGVMAGMAALGLLTTPASALASASASVSASVSVPAGALVRGWSMMPSPNPAIRTGQLYWVSCPATNSCMAVGTYVKASGAGVTLAELWNGSRWRVLPVPSPAGAAWSALDGVSCVSPSACEAVGATADRTGTFRALAESWNGSRWRIQPTDSPVHDYLLGVSCTSSSACTAVGGPQSGAPGKALTEHWDGTSWQSQPNPSLVGYFLDGVSCTSSACTAVGGSLTGAGLLAEAWNGSSWSIQSTPNPSEGGGFFDGVACTSASACTAVGGSNAGNLAENWNGATWSIQSVPSPAGEQFAFLNTVACPSASACIATGAYLSSSGTFLAQAERWDGTSWAIHPTPQLAGGRISALYGIACTAATSCLAVGFSSPPGGNQSPATLAEAWDGSSWHVRATPNPAGAAAGNLNAASCASRSDCVAVGNTSNSQGKPLTSAQRWNGHRWRIQATPSPADGGNLLGVSCPSRSTCVAIGGHGNPNNSIPPGTLAERWNGHRWRIQPTPNPRGRGWFLTAVSCTSASACTGVGGRLVPGTGQPTGTLAERWNGRQWRIQPTPRLRGKAVKLLTGVACTSASSCLAVGGEFNPDTGEALGTIAERWNGRKWQIVPTYKPAPHGPNAFFNGVSCASASACTAVGNRTFSKTLAERWTGRRWHVQATPNPGGGGNIFLAGVACPTRSVCTAFGLNLTGSGPLTLAERWSGGRWRIQPTPPVGAYDIGFPAVACPTSATCFAVASYTNNGPSVTLVEQWNGSGKFARPAAGMPVMSAGLPFACISMRLPACLPASERTPALAWTRFRDQTPR